MYRFVIKKAYAILLISLKEKNKEIKECAKEIGVSQGHLRIVLDSWNKKGIINLKREFTLCYNVSLTEKGEKIVAALENLMEVIDNEPVNKKNTEEIMKGVNADRNQQIFDQRKAEREKAKEAEMLRKIEEEKAKEKKEEELRKKLEKESKEKQDAEDKKVIDAANKSGDNASNDGKTSNKKDEGNKTSSENKNKGSDKK